MTVRIYRELRRRRKRRRRRRRRRSGARGAEQKVEADRGNCGSRCANGRKGC
jgi:hypothetical protein